MQKLRQYKEEMCLDFLLNPGLLVLRGLFFPFSALFEPFQGVPYFLMEEKNVFHAQFRASLCSQCRTAGSKRKITYQVREKRAGAGC